MFNLSAKTTLRFLKLSFVFSFAVMFLFGCIASEDEAAFSSNLVIAQNGQKEEAYEAINNLCKKYPTEARFCDEAKTLKNEIYSDNIKKVQEKLDQPKPISLADLKSAEESLEAATKYAATDEEVAKYKTSISDYKKQTKQEIENAVKQAEEKSAAGDNFSAYDLVKKVKDLDPAAIGKLVDEYGKAAVENGIKAVETLLAEDNLKDAKTIIDKMIKVDGNNEKVKEFSDLIEKNDNADYYLAKGAEAGESGKFELAIGYYKKALEFPDARVKAQELIDKTRVQIVEVSFMKGIESSAQELNKQAYDNFMFAFEMLKRLPQNLRVLVNVPKKDLEQYYDNMFYLGQKAFDDGAFGQSYLYYHMLFDLAPTYHGLRQAKKMVEDRVLDKALKSVAVTNFVSPASDPQLGMQVTTNITQILQKELNDDVKLTERGAFELLLREYELSVASGGNANAKQASPDEFKINSADYILTGEVLDSRTETNVQNSKKKVRVKTSEDKVRNIEWEDWSKEAADKRSQGLEIPAEPPKYILKPNYEYAEYDVTFYEKVSFLSISYRVVEPASGTVIYSNTVRAQKEAKDEATSGIDLGTYKVEMKVANLPTDIEMSNDVRKEAIAKITGQIKDMFKDQDVKYLEKAKKLESTNNLKEAVENYIYAMALMLKKGKSVDGLEDKAGKYLDILSVY